MVCIRARLLAVPSHARISLGFSPCGLSCFQVQGAIGEPFGRINQARFDGILVDVIPMRQETCAVILSDKSIRL